MVCGCTTRNGLRVRFFGAHAEIAIFRGWRNLLQFLPGRVHLALLGLALLPHLGPRGRGVRCCFFAAGRDHSAHSKASWRDRAFQRHCRPVGEEAVRGCGRATKSSIARGMPDRRRVCVHRLVTMVHFPLHFAARFSRKACVPSALSLVEQARPKREASSSRPLASGRS